MPLAFISDSLAIRLAMLAHLYGTPGMIEELKAVCDRRGVWVETGAIGNYSSVSLSGNKSITGTCGGIYTQR